jgi:hypothetical protein
MIPTELLHMELLWEFSQGSDLLHAPAKPNILSSYHPATVPESFKKHLTLPAITQEKVAQRSKTPDIRVINPSRFSQPSNR